MSILLLLLVLLPVAAGICCYYLRSGSLRTAIVLMTGGLLAIASLGLLQHGPFAYQSGSIMGIGWGGIVTVLDFALLFVVLYYGFKLQSFFIKLFTVSQIAILGFFELFMVDHHAFCAPLAGDGLSLIMVLIISIIGSLICIFGIPYMKRHEEHLKIKKSRQPQFFLFLVLFLGAMNGLVLANSTLWLYFFFEVTTFCSFMLIGHDKTDVAVKNATNALLINSFGGLAFLVGMVWAYACTGTLDITAMLASGPASGGLLLAVGFLCLAGLVKAAQLPFQSWLLGAMVAPTPVSALLHSSTMVKAGVYIVLRFAPLYHGSFVSDGIALCGAFTFLGCAALAVGQSNGKKILAYSTVSNLGLIIACAGLNTPLAISAAILLIIFHAISKSLLFLCVGTIEQAIGSRDIEDMRGLFKTLPRTAGVAIVGILTMLLPPFGVLLCKWMALEAASGHLFVVGMMALASALTVVYWARWAGLMMGGHALKRSTEQQPLLTKLPLLFLCLGSLVFSLMAPLIHSELIAPFMTVPAMELESGVLFTSMGGFALYPISLLVGLGSLWALFRAMRDKSVRIVTPYVGGSNVPEEGFFNGPMDSTVPYTASNYYLGEFFSESRITCGINIAAAGLIILMMGGAL